MWPVGRLRGAFGDARHASPHIPHRTGETGPFWASPRPRIRFRSRRRYDNKRREAGPPATWLTWPALAGPTRPWGAWWSLWHPCVSGRHQTRNHAHLPWSVFSPAAASGGPRGPPRPMDPLYALGGWAYQASLRRTRLWGRPARVPPHAPSAPAKQAHFGVPLSARVIACAGKGARMRDGGAGQRVERV